MKISFTRNVQFSRLIKVKGRLKEFNFRKSNATSSGLFSVDVVDKEGPMGNRIIFHMENKDENWRILTPGIPLWIAEKENEMNEVIREGLGKR